MTNQPLAPLGENRIGMVESIKQALDQLERQDEDLNRLF